MQVYNIIISTGGALYCANGISMVQNPFGDYLVPSQRYSNLRPGGTQYNQPAGRYGQEMSGVSLITALSAADW